MKRQFTRTDRFLRTLTTIVWLAVLCIILGAIFGVFGQGKRTANNARYIVSAPLVVKKLLVIRFMHQMTKKVNLAVEHYNDAYAFFVVEKGGKRTLSVKAFDGREMVERIDEMITELQKAREIAVEIAKQRRAP